MLPNPDRFYKKQELLLDIAQRVSEQGTCPRAKVGAIIAKEGRIISMGYNGAPSGMPHCSEVGCSESLDGGCTNATHAEANAITFAARKGIPTEGADLYCTHTPCLSCAKLIVNAGIKRVIYIRNYRDRTGMFLLQSAGVETFVDLRSLHQNS